MWQQFENQSNRNKNQIELVPRVDEKIGDSHSYNFENNLNDKNNNEDIIDDIKCLIGCVKREETYDEGENNEQTICIFETG